jgi:small subunit ribosomal protein S9
MFKDKATLAKAGLSVENDEEEWHPDEKRSRPMPYWLFMETVREDLEYEFRPPAVKRDKRPEAALIRHSLVDDQGRAFATGGRKNAKARVSVKLGDGAFSVNGRSIVDYFPVSIDRRECIVPLMAVHATGAFDVEVKVRGGGHSGQAGAIKHALARALARFDPYLRLPLRRLRLLRRDPRAVERKKIGLAKARRAFQWVKR